MGIEPQFAFTTVTHIDKRRNRLLWGKNHKNNTFSSRSCL